MKCFLLLLIGLLFFHDLFSQNKNRLPAEMNEVSGLEMLNDSILIAINDSGNSSDIFFIDLKGTVLKKCSVSNATNSDWEDLAIDDAGNLYIADVGNNLNNRQDLCIWKVRVEEAFKEDSVMAQKITFRYEDQTEFPPGKERFRFDCEAIYWMNDSIRLITKNRSKKPKSDSHGQRLNGWDRFPDDYVIPDEPGNYLAQHVQPAVPYFKKVKSSGIRDLVTGADHSNGAVAILTYSGLRIMYLNRSDVGITASGELETHNFKRLEQREAIVFLSDRVIAVASEKHPLLGGPFLTIFTLE